MELNILCKRIDGRFRELTECDIDSLKIILKDNGFYIEPEIQ